MVKEDWPAGMVRVEADGKLNAGPLATYGEHACAAHRLGGDGDVRCVHARPRDAWTALWVTC